jgi:hypothetical protein
MIDQAANALIKTANLLSEKRADYHRQLLVAGSALFGILISFHKSTGECPLARLTFAVAVVLLALGILSSAVSLYRPINAIARARKLYTEEAIQALHEDREPDYVAVGSKMIFEVFGIASCSFFVLSVLLLSAYVVLVTI